MFIISDNLWDEIKIIIPKKKSRVGRPLKDSKIVLSSIYYIMITGAQWHKLPDYYGRPTPVHSRFRSWIKSGIFEEILTRSTHKALQHFGPPESFFNDTYSIKAPLAKFGGKNPTGRAKYGIKKGMVTDSAWDVKKLRQNLAKENIALHASINARRDKSKKKIKSGGRWRIEQVFGIQQWNGGIKLCWTKTQSSFLALCQLASAIHNFKLIGIFG